MTTTLRRRRGRRSGRKIEGKLRLIALTRMSRCRARVLVTAEAPEILRSIGASMGMLGFPVVDLIGDGSALHEGVIAHDYDILILDADMVGANACAVARFIRRRHSGYGIPPPLVIFYSRRAPARYRQKAAVHGADHAFPAPPSRHDLHRIFVTRGIF